VKESGDHSRGRIHKLHYITRAIATSVTRWPLTRVRTLVSPCEIHGGQFAIRTRFYQSSSVPLSTSFHRGPYLSVYHLRDE
jgi:hypothetical protein